MSDLTVTCKKFYLPLSAMALLGIVMGILCPSIQVAVEPAQVLAGIVEYPRDNPFYIYQAKVWTILHQVTAVWLWLGMSDDMAFRILSCVGPFAGMLGMALVVRAVAPAHMMICVIPLFAFQIARGWGMNYPVLFAGAPHTYGLVGSQTVMLCLGLFAAGRPKLGAALLGVLPAIHPSLGVWAGLVIATGYAWHVRGRWRRMVPLLLPFGCGCLVTVISLTIHFGFFADVPSISAEEASIYHRAWIEHWDGHRKPLSWLKPQNAVLLSGFILSLAWLCCYRRKMTRNGAFILRVVFVAFAIGIPAVAITHISPERVPVIAVALMPTRPLNISVVLYPLLLMGFIWHFRRTVVVPAWLFLIVGLAATKIFPTPIEWALGTPLVLVLLAVVDRNKSLLAFGVGALALIGAVSLGSIGLLIIGVALPPVGVWLSRRPFCTRALHHGVVKRWWGGKK